jgi:hypothetical protein
MCLNPGKSSASNPITIFKFIKPFNSLTMKPQPLLIIACSIGLAFQFACQPAERPAESLADVPVADSSQFIIEAGRNVGLISSSSTVSDIQKAYGVENTLIQQINTGEGEVRPGIVVFPDSPNAIEVIMDIPSATGTPQFIRISNRHTAWKTADGISIGTSIADLEAANGRPFHLMGFEWDFSGLIYDWNGGQLPPSLIIAMVPGDDKPVPEALRGEVQLSSRDSMLLATAPIVGSMVITFSAD